MTKTGSEKRILRLAGALVCLVLAMLLPMAVHAAGKKAAISVDPVNHKENCSAVLYNNVSGLPTSDANDITATEDGFIWIASYSGLIRYDGNTFERLDSRTGLASVTDLLADSKGRLWIATNDSGLVMMEDGELRYWRERNGLGSDKVDALAEDRDGTIYVGSRGIMMISENLKVTPIKDPLVEKAYIEQMKVGEDGLIYCTTGDDDYFTLRDGKLVDYVSHTDIKIGGITCLMPDPYQPGKLYIGTEEGKLYYGNPAGSAPMIEYADISPLFEVLDIKQFGDQIWICSRAGIGVLDHGEFTYLGDLPMNNSVNKVISDYEGNLWFTSSRQGVMKLVPNRFSDISKKYNLPETVVNSTCMLGGRLFIGMDDGLMVTGKSRRIETIPLTEAKTASGKDLGEKDLLELLDGVRIRSIIRDSKDRLWISTWRGVGLVRYDGEKVMTFSEEDGLFSDQIRAVSEMEDGSVIVALTGGINVIKGDRITASYGQNEGLGNPETLSVCTAPNGDMIMGSNGTGLYIINDEGVRSISTKNGLPSDIIMRIKYDAGRKLFWIVASNALAYMTEDYEITTIKDFPYANNFDLFENSKGDMWILSSNGIYVLPADDLVENGELNPVHYGIANGLSCTATNNSYSELTESGELYMAGLSGVAKVNIEESMEDVSDLKAAVPFIDADGKILYPDEKGRFKIPSSVQRLTINAFVFNYALTDPLVSYRLKPFDREPETISRSKLAPVTYTKLPGDTYHFEIEIMDAMGRGSNKLSVPIIKEKAYYEQIWFFALIGFLAGLLIISSVAAYIRRRMRVLEEQHKEEAEKERVTHELQMANRIQGSMLPSVFPAFPERSDFDLHASMTPAKEVGGDFYDFFMIDDDHLGLVIADVSGKGIPAAMLMTISKTLIKNELRNCLDPAEAVRHVNLQLCEQNDSMMFVTVWLAVLELSTGKGKACNAGHENPCIRRAGGEFEVLKYRHNLVVGAMEMSKYANREFELSPGDCVFVYTDGVTEAAAVGYELYGENRVAETLNRDPDARPEELVRRVYDDVNRFAEGMPQFDDMTMLCVKYLGNKEPEH